ncbi:hypothetical protein STEG23_025452 [Scotinomys teguina]
MLANCLEKIPPSDCFEIHQLSVTALHSHPSFPVFSCDRELREVITADTYFAIATSPARRDESDSLTLETRAGASMDSAERKSILERICPCIFHSFIISSSAVGYLGRCHVLSLVKTAEMDTDEHISL